MTISLEQGAKRALVEQLQRIAAALDHYSGGGDASPDHVAPAMPGRSDDTETPLDWLIRIYGLSPFEADIVLLCAGMELDARCAGLVARIQNGGPPTFSLALAALENAHWSALLPDAPLRRWQLLAPLPAGRLVSAPLQIDERILHFLVGLPSRDQRLSCHAALVGETIELAPSQLAVAERLAMLWTGAAEREETPPSILLVGGDPAIRRAIAAHAARSIGLALLAVVPGSIPDRAAELDEVVRLIEREALLESAWILLEAEQAGLADDDGGPLAARAGLRRIKEQLSLPAIISADIPPSGIEGLLVVTVNRVAPVERIAVWRQLLAGTASTDAQLTAIAHQFELPVSAMKLAAIEATSTTAAPEGTLGRTEAEALPHRLWTACRHQARSLMPPAVERIEPSADWSQLVLPPRESAMLKALIGQIAHRARVHGDWGMGGHGAAGSGCAALFAGPSGTGKTLAAEVLARALDLDLYRIDLSLVISKYIGETEKNLRRLFDGAEAGGAILLFDEADALFGKRSEVKDSHDRHANIEVSYLLQRIEAYGGLAILTTNLKDSIDSAFLRRFRFVIDFPFPEASQREAIWRATIPAQIPSKDLDFGKLAQLNVAGGNIRSIALNAAFLAAAQDGSLGMEHLREAARLEYAKLGRSVPDAELRGW